MFKRIAILIATTLFSIIVLLGLVWFVSLPIPVARADLGRVGIANAVSHH
jgi:hypothetical protein